MLKRTPLKRNTPLKRTPFKCKPPKAKVESEGEPISESKPKRRSKTDRQKLIEELDRVFSIYIRIKDAAPITGYVKCFTSGRILHWKDAQCGHFCSRRSLSTRWEEMNCHPQSMEQNVFEHGNLLVYREKMVRKYGENEVNKLILRSNTPCHISEFELKQMIDYYTKKVEEIKKDKGL